jgi:2-isopropylmalate synthase
VEFSCEDGSRTELDFLVEVVTKVIEAGATVINIPDTVGYATPVEYAGIFKHLRENVPNIDKVILSCHCHDDLGMAVANSLAAIEAGVRQVEGCINGIGERAGNVALEEVVMALETRYDFYNARASWNLKEIARTSKLISRMTGMIVPGNKAIVGANAFAHESGIHQDGVLKDKTTYEIMKPETIGVGDSKLVMGKHSGRHAFKEKLLELGYHFDADQINVLFKKFKDLADRKKTIVDEDILALVEEKVSTQETYYDLNGIQLSYGNQMVPTAVVHLTGKSGRLEETATGNGSVDAIFKAIDKAVAEVVELVDYRIVSVTHGKDALGEVHLKLQQNDLIVLGRGVSTDILEASAKAYVDALNRLLNRKHTGRGGRQDLSISFG